MKKISKESKIYLTIYILITIMITLLGWFVNESFFILYSVNILHIIGFGSKHLYFENDKH